MMTAPPCGRDDDAEGHFKKQLFGPLHPSTLRSISLRRVNPLKGLGHRDEPFRMECRVGSRFKVLYYSLLFWSDPLDRLADQSERRRVVEGGAMSVMSVGWGRNARASHCIALPG